MPADRRLGPPDAAAQRTEPLDTEERPREDIIARWRERGYDTRVEIVDGGDLRCGSCDATHPPEAWAIDDTFRYEGISAPEDMELLLAVTCGSCSAQGTLTVAYGPYTGPDEAEALRRLPDHRTR